MRGVIIAVAVLVGAFWLMGTIEQIFGWAIPWLFFGGSFFGIGYGLAVAWRWAMRD